ncbi:MAG: aminodeoxychorismate/anthranilate synthase component II, partial [Chromatiales bacterium]|nr:aminodeoxychorismate/anthranilate synthase component II [Chromatiales bacterium]
TYNLVQYLGELGAQVTTRRNDVISVADALAMAPDAIVLSPGPCTPNEAGVCLELVERVAGDIPLLGVCLGHQCIAQAFGGKIVHAEAVMHGKTSSIAHDGRGVFAGLPSPYRCTRYHSLVVEYATLPTCFELTAWTADIHGVPEIMGIRHRDLAVESVQFHPESILTEHGHALLRNFLNSVAVAA